MDSWLQLKELGKSENWSNSIRIVLGKWYDHLKRYQPNLCFGDRYSLYSDALHVNLSDGRQKCLLPWNGFLAYGMHCLRNAISGD